MFYISWLLSFFLIEGHFFEWLTTRSGHVWKIKLSDSSSEEGRIVHKSQKNKQNEALERIEREICEGLLSKSGENWKGDKKKVLKKNCLKKKGLTKNVSKTT